MYVNPEAAQHFNFLDEKSKSNADEIVKLRNTGLSFSEIMSLKKAKLI